MLRRVFFLLLVFPAIVNAAHITDKLLAGMYAKPDSAEQPVQLLPSSTPVELMGETKGFVKVQLVDGKTGWVEKRFISDQKPAKVRLLSLQSKYRKLQEKLDRTEEKLAGLKQPVQPVLAEGENKEKAEAKLQAALAKAKDEIQQLQQQIKQPAAIEFSNQKIQQKEDNSLIWAGFLLVLFFAALGGVYFGMRLQDARQLKRHGGFRI